MNRRKAPSKRQKAKRSLTDAERLRLARRLSEVSKAEVRELILVSEAFRELRRQVLSRRSKAEPATHRAR
jgi:hypothetical protein